MNVLRDFKVVGTALAAAVLVLGSVSCGNDGSSDSPSSNSENDGESSSDDSNRGTDEASDSGQSNGSKKSRDSGAERRIEDTASKPVRPRGKTYRVTEVVDGDTVHLAKPGETSVRIIGIDTPETVDPSTPIECGGPAASATAERLLAGELVRLVYDPSQGRHDSYGRVLGYLEVPGVGDFGRRMITRGLASEYTYDTAYQRRPQYLAAQRHAQGAGRGVWDRCGGVDTPLEPPTTEPETEAPPDESDPNCVPGYDPCVPPYPPDLDCDDVDGPIRITGDDPHGFDADGDGIGCDT